MSFQKVSKFHFIGIGGIGMSALAFLLRELGHQVSGSDAAESDTTRKLKEKGVTTFVGHNAAHLSDVDFVVVSSAIKANNPELLAAQEKGFAILHRAQMLAELMTGKLGLSVAGTHGKTTTTSMLATILISAELDPSVIVGGKIAAMGGNSRLGKGQHFIAEADESDGSFILLPTTLAIITNIDDDHVDHFGTLAKLEQAFVDFANKVPEEGCVVLCGDDKGVQRIQTAIKRPVKTYGLNVSNDFRATQIETLPTGTRFNILEGNLALGTITLAVPGIHNVLNALAAFALCRRIGLSFDQIQKGLETYKGVGRRFDIRFSDEIKHQTIVDDYAHHPAEVAATLAAARNYWKGRIIAVFQPHRYTRTQRCFDGFVEAFQKLGPTDTLFITDLYSAGETPIEGVDSKALAEKISGATASGALAATKMKILDSLRENDLVLLMGAGSITNLAADLANTLSAAKLKAWLELNGSAFTGQLLYDEPLSRHTYYRIGGPAKVFAAPRTRADLLLLGRGIRETGAIFSILGSGSNLLVSDQGFAGLVIYNQYLNREISTVKAANGSDRIRTGASLAVSAFVKASMENGWGGLEFLCGIPGSVGGVVIMNAGTFLGEASDRLTRVEAIPFTDPNCEILVFEKDQLQFTYRSEKFLPPNTLVWAAEWDFTPAKPEAVRKTITDTLQKRKTSQPLDFPSCGSVFKNPPGKKAWEVINELGLKGHRIGNAQVSVKHSNFIVNLGGATGTDVLALIDLIQKRAKAEMGVDLQLEVKVLGNR